MRVGRRAHRARLRADRRGLHPCDARRAGLCDRTRADKARGGRRSHPRATRFSATPPAPSPRKARDSRVFYEFTLAYTYADPKHWSRAVNRLALDAPGRLGERRQMEARCPLRCRSCLHAVRLLPAGCKKNQRATAIWRENYLDFDVGGWDFRVGAQNIIWGDVVGLFFADVVSARDLRDFLLPSFDVIRIPQWAARAEYSKGDSHVELVWIPVQTFDNIGKPGSDFYPVPLPSPTPAAVAAAFQNPDKPSQTLETRATVSARTRWLAVGMSRRSITAASAPHRRSIANSREWRPSRLSFNPATTGSGRQARPSTKISGAWCCTVRRCTRKGRTSRRWTRSPWTGWWRDRRWTGLPVSMSRSRRSTAG